MATERLQVVSEINTFLNSASSKKPIASEKNKVAKLSFSAPKRKNQKEDKETGSTEGISRNGEAKVDMDGDLVLPRKTDNTDLEDLSVFIEYENSTTLDKVGLQVWRGAFLLADFIIHYQEEFMKGKRILELGSGTGLTAVIASMFASHVTATDIQDPAILHLLEVNSKTHNKNLLNCEFDVRPLDFLDMNWTKEVTERVAQSDIILAADVVYHVNITTAFVKTLKKLATTGNKPKHIFIAMEKRYVFTVADLDTGAPMYDHFMDELENILQIYPGCLGKPIHGETGDIFHLTLQFHPTDIFPQYFSYERNAHLVLLHLKSVIQQPKTL